MDSLLNILGNKDFDEPPLIQDIKKYVQLEFKSNVGVQIRENDIILTVQSASLANMLKLRSAAMKQTLKIDKRITYRINPSERSTR